MLTSRNTWYSEITVPSVVTDTINITTTPTNKALGDITLPDYEGVCDFAYLEMMFNAINNEDAGNANNTNGAQYIQAKKAGGSFANYLLIPTLSFRIAANILQAGHHPLMGTVDLAAICTPSETLSIQWALSKSNTNSMDFYEIQTKAHLFVRKL